jgi:squalene-hopene/tetraprenyl-beta-curcumene cyclase
MKLPSHIHRAVAFLVIAGGIVSAARAAEPSYDQVVANAQEFLVSKGQAEDGSFSSQIGPGITGLVTTALIRSGRTPDDPAVAKSLKYLEGFVQPDGGVYLKGSRLKNYETCIILAALSEANKDGRYDDTLKNAQKFLRGEQFDEADQIDKADAKYGGAGYGGDSRPDLSNTHFLIEALRATGSSEDDEAVQKALVFVSRCQNLESEFNTFPEAAKINDGGFYYTVAAGGGSAAGRDPDGGLRSYASMTYAGLKSMVYAGLTKDDPRVKAAHEWISKHYDLESNPGMGTAGLYYYYHTFAKALDALGEKSIVDADGKEHDWRADLLATLAAKQKADGSFVNANDRWMEGDANLSTGFALLALTYAKPTPQP